MDVQKEIIVAQLYKSARNDRRVRTHHSADLSFSALGYYDKVTLKLNRNSYELAQYCDRCNDVYTECVVLIPASDCVLPFADETSMGVLTFILTDILPQSQGKTDTVRTLCQELEHLHQEDPLITSKAYLTTSASSIAVLSVCKDLSVAASALKRYFIRMQKYCLAQRRCVNSFSVPMIRFSEKEACAAEISKNASGQEYPFDAVNIAFASKFEEQKDEFYSWLDRLKGTVSAYYGCRIDREGILSGTEDYLLQLAGMTPSELVHLFSSENMLSDETSDYYDATNTTLIFQPCVEDDRFVQIPEKLKEKLDKDREKGDEKCGSDEALIPNVVKTLTAIEEIQEYRHYLEAFDALQDSRYTRWVCRKYTQVMETYGELLWSQLVRKDAVDIIKENTRAFFDALYSMLESLLNTSVYFTDSPGFRKIENNIVPRWILSNQKIINDYAAAWDELANRESDSIVPRVHTFLLTPHTGYEVSATMLFGTLPPDLRLIILNLPIRYALRPVFSFPLLLHEVGHYIGVRNRKEKQGQKGREYYFIELTSSLFCRSVMDYYMTGLIDQDAQRESVHDGGFQQITLMPKQQQFISTLAFALARFQKTLFQNVMEIYRQVVEEKIRILKEHRETSRQKYTAQQMNMDAGDAEDKVIQRELQALSKGYFSEMSILIKSIYIDILPDIGKKIIQEFQRVCDEQMAVDVTNQDMEETCIGMELYLSETYPDFQEQTLQSLYNMNTSRETDFVTEAQSVLSEVAADVFMILSLGMTLDDYLLLFFEQYYSSSPEMLADYISCFDGHGGEKIRMLAISSAMAEIGSWHGIEKEIRSRINSIAGMQKDGSEIAGRSETEYKITDAAGYSADELLNMYQKLKNNLQRTDEKYTKELSRWKGTSLSEMNTILSALNPYYGVKQYVNQIMNDERYRNTEKMTKIRTIFENAKKEENGIISINTLFQGMDDD